MHHIMPLVEAIRWVRASSTCAALRASLAHVAAAEPGHRLDVIAARVADLFRQMEHIHRPLTEDMQ